MIALYGCLEEMLGEMNERERKALVGKLLLLTDDGVCKPAKECVVPDADVYKQRLAELARAHKPNLSWVSPALLGLGRVLSASVTQGNCIPLVPVDFEISDFRLTHKLTEAIKKELVSAGLSVPALQIALCYDFQLGNGSGSCLNADYMLLKRYQANVKPDRVQYLSMSRDGGKESTSLLLVLKLNAANHIKYLGTVSEAFTRLLHASLAMLLRSQYEWEADRAMQVAGDIVVAANKRVPDALLPAATTVIKVQSRYSLGVPYESIFLSPPDKLHGTENCLVLHWHEPGGHARPPAERKEEEVPVRRVEMKQLKMTREQYLQKLEQGIQAERYAHELFLQVVPGYKPQTCWLSESKKEVLAQGDPGPIDEGRGN